MLSLLQTQASNPHEGQKLHYRMCCYNELGSMTALCNISFRCAIDTLLDICVCIAHVAGRRVLQTSFPAVLSCRSAAAAICITGLDVSDGKTYKSIDSACHTVRTTCSNAAMAIQLGLAAMW